MSETKAPTVEPHPWSQPPDCGDSSCEYAKTKTGMRTNGGCRCYKDCKNNARLYAKWMHHEMRALADRLEELEGLVREQLAFMPPQDWTVRARAALDKGER